MEKKQSKEEDNAVEGDTHIKIIKLTESFVTDEKENEQQDSPLIKEIKLEPKKKKEVLHNSQCEANSEASNEKPVEP